jgi:hypothetical protein
MRLVIHNWELYFLDVLVMPHVPHVSISVGYSMPLDYLKAGDLNYVLSWFNFFISAYFILWSSQLMLKINDEFYITGCRSMQT